MEDSENPAGLFDGTMDAEDLAWVTYALSEAFDVLESRPIPDLPRGALDPRRIPGGLRPRPATTYEEIAQYDVRAGWPMVAWKGSEYANLRPKIWRTCMTSRL